MKTTARILCLFTAILMCVSLTACGTNPIDIVKNGEFDAYPGKPFEKTLRQIVQKVGGTINELKWEDLSEEVSDSLNDDQRMVRLHFKATAGNETEEFISLFIVNIKDKSFIPFSVEIEEESSTDYKEMMYFYDSIFGD